MEASGQPRRVLIVAHRTAATPALIEAVRQRAQEGPAAFTLLVPNPAHGLHRVVDPEDADRSEAEQVLALALPLLEEAARGGVEGMVGDANPMNAIHDAVNLRGFDEIIISTLPAPMSKWLRRDLPRRVMALGPPVTVITPERSTLEQPQAPFPA